MDEAIGGSDEVDAAAVTAAAAVTVWYIADVSLRIQTGSLQIMHSGDNFSFFLYFPFVLRCVHGKLRVQRIERMRIIHIVVE